MTAHPSDRNSAPTTATGPSLPGDRELLAQIEAQSSRFDRQVRRRDWREIIAGLIVVLVIGPAAVRGPLLSRVGAFIITGGVCLATFQLWRARRRGGSDSGDLTMSVAEALRAELRRVNAQIALLESVAWWYVAPLMTGSVIMVMGRVGGLRSWFTLAYAAFAALVGWGIIALNRRAVRRVLLPKREELTVLLAQLES